MAGAMPPRKATRDPPNKTEGRPSGRTVTKEEIGALIEYAKSAPLKRGAPRTHRTDGEKGRYLLRHPYIMGNSDAAGK